MALINQRINYFKQADSCFLPPELQAALNKQNVIPIEEDYKLLWATVLLQAYNDINDNNKILSQSTQYWVNNNNTGIGSIIWICEALDLDLSFIRKKMLRNIKKGPKKWEIQ